MLIATIPESAGSKPALSPLRMFLLTFCMVGIQFTWTVELSYGTPYLLSLELSKEATALVWLAGPMSGLLMQPLIGVLSDRTTSKFGRRRPYIAIGSVLVCCSLLGVAFARDIATFMINILGKEAEDPLHYARIIAIVLLWLLDFVLNAVQASCRALIVDVPPVWQQDAANAMASSMSNITMVFTYIVGFLDLTAYLPVAGDSQFKVLCVIAIFVFLIAQSVTCLSITEEVYDVIESDLTSWRDTARQVFRSFRSLPRPIQLVCNVIFFAWMGWFPFLFYSTTWVSSIYFQTHPDKDSSDWASGARAGSFALLCYAIVAVISGIFLPALTTHSIRNVTLKNVWTFSLLVFSITMISTHFVSTVGGATIILSLLGLSWACIMWIPFALIGEYLNIYNESQRATYEEPILRKVTYGALHRARIGEGSGSLDDVEANAISQNNDWFLCSQCESGMVLGILNMYVVFPQFVVAIIASAIFYFVDLGVGDNLEDNSTYKGISILLQFSGIMALIATGLSRYVIDVEIGPKKSI
ncbi:major facilitator superfamily domain-containing protein [Umbelopsis sp. AD052]|nr:major facilitator superfamily domain-containing protein [Umbelopsis sp. AD052]